MNIEIPAELQAPAGAKPPLELRAIGVQIYVCQPKDGKFQWVLRRPEADLMDATGRKVAHHFRDDVAAFPAWLCLSDGSKVIGNAKDAKRAPMPNTIDWLMVPAVPNDGKGILSGVKSIQRVATLGGRAPETAEAKDEGQELRVYYDAVYIFNY